MSKHQSYHETLQNVVLRPIIVGLSISAYWGAIAAIVGGLY